jgi:hypothetical protein
MRSLGVILLAATILLVAICGSTTSVTAGRFTPSPAKDRNMSATFNCTSNKCDDPLCRTATVPLGTCFFNPLVSVWLQYDIIGNDVQITIYGPWKWMCNDNNINIKKRFACDTCVYPAKAGAWTVYHCDNITH